MEVLAFCDFLGAKIVSMKSKGCIDFIWLLGFTLLVMLKIAYFPSLVFFTCLNYFVSVSAKIAKCAHYLQLRL